MGVRNWIDASGTPDDVVPFLVRVDFEGDCRGWLTADVSGVMDLLSGQAYASFIDEDHDTYAVYRLTDMGPVLVKVETQQQHEWINVRLSWRQPGVPGKAGRRHTDGFYKILGA